MLVLLLDIKLENDEILYAVIDKAVFELDEQFEVVIEKLDWTVEDDDELDDFLRIDEAVFGIVLGGNEVVEAD